VAGEKIGVTKTRTFGVQGAFIRAFARFRVIYRFSAAHDAFCMAALQRFILLTLGLGNQCLSPSLLRRAPARFASL
jgi:hypothetical protein